MDFLLTSTMEIITMIFTVIFLLLIVYYVAYTQNKKFKVHSNLSYMRKWGCQFVVGIPELEIL